MRIIQRFRGILLLAVLALSAACATAPKRVEKVIPKDHFAEIKRPDIPLVMNDRVQDWMNYFQGKGRPYFERYLARSGRYIPMIHQVLRQNGLPQDLVYLAMIESGFNPHAYSRAAASGTWQFIYQTGVRYGLKVNQWVDERRDPEKSTVAAAKYLKDLYDRYNDWYLAAAGYNAGEGKIDRAIKKYATEDFWELSEGKYLRNETKDYVPKLIAAAVIARNPEKYGFLRVEYEKPVGFEDVELDRAVDLRIAAKCAGADYGALKALNPELLHWVTPPSTGRYSLKIPAGTKEKFLANLAALPDKKLMGDEIKKVDESTSVRKLAREHGLPAELLAAANGLSADDSIKSGTSVVLPLSPPEGEGFYEKNYERRKGGRMIAYRVRKGESVQTISRKLGITVAALRDYNPHINWSHVRAGQKLKLQTSSARSRYAQNSSKSKSSKSFKNSRNSKKHKGELAMRSKGETKKAKAARIAKKSKRVTPKSSVSSPSM